MPDGKKALEDLWADTPMVEDNSIINQHVKSFMKYVVIIGIFVGILNAVLVGILGAFAIALILPINLTLLYVVVNKLFAEVDHLIVRRIRRREGNLSENLSE